MNLRFTNLMALGFAVLSASVTGFASNNSDQNAEKVQLTSVCAPEALREAYIEAYKKADVAVLKKGLKVTSFELRGVGESFPPTYIYAGALATGSRQEDVIMHVSVYARKHGAECSVTATVQSALVYE